MSLRAVDFVCWWVDERDGRLGPQLREDMLLETTTKDTKKPVGQQRAPRACLLGERDGRLERD